MTLMTGLLTTCAQVPESTAMTAACGLTLASSLALHPTSSHSSRWMAPLRMFLAMRLNVLWALPMETELLARLVFVCAVRSSCSLSRMMNRPSPNSLREVVALASARPLQLSSLVSGAKMPWTAMVGLRTWRTPSSSCRR